MKNRASEKMQNGSCDAVIAAALSVLHSGLQKDSTSPKLDREIRDFRVMKQVHKDASVTNVPFNQYQRQLCLPGEVEN